MVASQPQPPSQSGLPTGLPFPCPIPRTAPAPVEFNPEVKGGQSWAFSAAFPVANRTDLVAGMSPEESLAAALERCNAPAREGSFPPACPELPSLVESAGPAQLCSLGPWLTEAPRSPWADVFSALLPQSFQLDILETACKTTQLRPPPLAKSAGGGGGGVVCKLLQICLRALLMSRLPRPS